MIILNMRLDVKTFYPQSDVMSGGLDLSLSHLSRQCCQPPSRQTYHFQNSDHLLIIFTRFSEHLASNLDLDQGLYGINRKSFSSYCVHKLGCQHYTRAWQGDNNTYQSFTAEG